MGIDSLIERFVLHLKIRGFSSNTIESYSTDLKDFADFFKDKPLKIEWIIKYKDKLVEKEYKNSTYNRKLSSIRAFLKFLYKSGVLEIDYSLLRNKRDTRKPPVYISKDLIEQAMTKDRDGLIVRLMYATGLRVSEIAKLKVSDVLFDTGFIRIKGKGKKERFVPVDKTTLELLKNYLSGRNYTTSKDFVFISNRKRAFTRQGLWKIIKRKFRKIGVELKPHTLRHMFATHMLENGANIRAVQEMLGHESITTTQIYTDITDNSLQEAFNKFDIIK